VIITCRGHVAKCRIIVPASDAQSALARHWACGRDCSDPDRTMSSLGRVTGVAGRRSSTCARRLHCLAKRRDHRRAPLSGSLFVRHGDRSYRVQSDVCRHRQRSCDGVLTVTRSLASVALGVVERGRRERQTRLSSRNFRWCPPSRGVIPHVLGGADLTFRPTI
jgi:hypothetical protein